MALEKGFEISVTETLVVEHCYKCGIPFGMPASFKNQLLRHRDEQSFYCPNGHGQVYAGETPEAKAKRLEQEKAEVERKLAQSQNDVQIFRNEVFRQKDLKEKLKVRHSRYRNRVKNGVCPHCNRTFKDLQRHFKCKHPKA